MPTTEKRQKIAHVKLGTEEKEVPAGPTLVRVLKQELGVDPADVLYLVHGLERRVLADDETIDVKSGQHYEAIGGGGVS
ncbi:MAG: hypothetical protein AABM30_04925 [Actinomycetota bacterium]